MADRIQFRRGTEARWATVDPILMEGEIGYVSDKPNQHKMGDGISRWSELPYRGFDGTLVHEAGNSETSVMTQKATTDYVDKLGVFVVGNEEFVYALIDEEDKVLYGIRYDGTVFQCATDDITASLISDLLSRLSLKVDKEEGKGLINLVVSSMFSVLNDGEFIQVVLDSDGKILSYIDKQGVKHETSLIIDKTINIPTKEAEKIVQQVVDGNNNLSIKLFNKAVSDDATRLAFEAKMKADGFSIDNVMDWSDKSLVHIPMPRFGMLNIISPVPLTAITKKSGLGTAGVDCDIEAVMEFWDKSGNYFKKPIVISGQGSSSMNYYIKNLGFDFTDGSKIKLGNCVSQDSFHLKKWYIDVFRGQAIASYHLGEQIYQTRKVCERKPWQYIDESSSFTNGTGVMGYDFNQAALCHPDGFPFVMYWNGAYSGLYTFALKKHRDNYNMDKSEANKNILDGNLNNSSIWGGNVDWTQFEIRNPKNLNYAPYDELSLATKTAIDSGIINEADTVGGVDYYRYNGDFPDLITNNASVRKGVSAAARANIERLATAYGLSTTKEVFEEYFNVPFFIDYWLHAQVTYNYDGFSKNWIWCTWGDGKWCPTFYDHDSIFGIIWTGNWVIDDVTPIITGRPSDRLWDLYQNEIKERYAELRNKGVFSVSNIMRLLEDWVNRIGYENLDEEIKYCASLGCDIPSYRASNVNPQWKIRGNYVTTAANYDNTKVYNAGDAVYYQSVGFSNFRNRFDCLVDGTVGIPPLDGTMYSKVPYDMGFYNSLTRVEKWLEARIAYLDTYFSYNV